MGSDRSFPLTEPSLRRLPARGRPTQSTTVISAAMGAVVGPLPALRGVDGQEIGLASFPAGRTLVLAFLGDSCPAVEACVPSLVDLQRRFEARGLQVVAVNSNNPFLSPMDSPTEMSRFARDWGLNFPYLKDFDGQWARGVGATNTPHFVVLDQNRRIRYRGRMFDSRDPERASSRDLEDAVVGVLEGRSVASSETRALGCSIVW